MKQSGAQMRHTAAESAKIKKIQFTLLSKEEIDRWAVVEIKNTKLYNNRHPTREGLNDLRMGVSTVDQKCETCGETKECQGHFGVIKLPEPIYHYGFLKFVEKVLKCICNNCSKLRKPLKSNGQLDPRFITILKNYTGRKKLIELSKLLVNVTTCEVEKDMNPKEGKKGCGFNLIPNKIQIKDYKIMASCKMTKKMESNKDNAEFTEKSTEQQELTADIVYKMLEKIDPQDAALMGFTNSKPVDLLIWSLLVCPPQLRPVVEMNPQKSTEDGMTLYYNHILSSSLEIIKDRNSGKVVISADKKNRIRALELQVASIMQKFKGISVKVKQNSKPLKSFADRLKGKEGRFRQHLMGKRVDFSARSVISPDSNLALDELGVPQKIAAQLTFPEEITALNIDRIRKLYEEGKVLFFMKPTQDRRKYEPVQSKDIESFNKELTYGVIAERCIQDGDFVLFNRQPTLHRMSMMGHRVKILPYNTFRLNLSVCAPYNADFDGDEMNMHVPQNYETLAEIKHIAHVPRQIVTPKHNQPVMGMVQDALLGIFLFTLRDTFLTREEVMNLVIWIDSIEGKEDFETLQVGELPVPAIIKPVPLWTGKQIMSMIIPSKISIVQRKDRKEGEFLRNWKDTSMIIRRGELIMGALQKQIVGSGAGGLIHNIWLDIGPDATSYFLTTAQRIVNNWLTMNSFSCGAADVVPTIGCTRTIATKISATEEDFWRLFEVLRSKERIDQEKNLHHKEKTIMESFEVHVNQKLNEMLTTAQKLVAEEISPFKNNIYKMIWAKSKGSETNLTQIVAVLGNQNVDGKRIPEGFSKRTLPHFCKEDRSPEPRGFVYSSFYTGLKPHEFFFHSMGGREGLSDTAVKTARTGYIQRKLIKALEDVIVKYDGTVRDSQNNLVQNLYGEDGFAGEYIEKQALPLEDPEDKFEADNHWDISELANTYKTSEEGIMQLEDEFAELVTVKEKLKYQYCIENGPKEIYLPIKVDRLINNIKQKEGKSKPSLDLSPLFVFKEVEKLLDICIHPQYQHEYKQIEAMFNNSESLQRNDREKKERKKIFEEEAGLVLFRGMVKICLSSKKICKYHCLTKAGFTTLIELIKAKFTQALINPGEAIGAIAAQCVGEPTTQMTLNTFHSAGIKAGNVTLGVPRLQELVEVSRNMKNTALKIYLNPDADRDFRRYVKELPEMYMGDFIYGTRIYYDYGNCTSFIENVNNEDQIGLEENSSAKVTPWLMMFLFDAGLQLSAETKDKVKTDLIKLTERFAKMTRKHYNDDKIFVYLRCLENFTSHEASDEKFNKRGEFDYYSFLKHQEQKIRAHRIGGIDNIKKIFTMDNPYPKRTPNGEMEHPMMLITEGTNLRKALTMNIVDNKRTTSNSITEILEVLGIEAARQSFLNEFKDVLKPYGIYINSRHLITLADWMTRRGKLTPINRNGINRISDVSVLRKASFEETVEILYDAAIFSEEDPLKGVSEKIIVGENVELGTGNFQILIDKTKVKDFKISNAMDNKEDVENQYRTVLEPYPDIRTPLAIQTPGPYAGGSSYYRSVQSPRLGVMSPSFTPNIIGRFTPDVHQEFTSTNTSRSPAITMTLGTPIMDAMRSTNNGEYSPSASPTYNNPSPNVMGVGRAFLPQSPYYLASYPNPNPQSPRYNSTVSPSYSHSRSGYPSSRQSHSPGYSQSPSYSGTPMDRNAKNEEKSDDDDYDDQ